MFISQSAGQSLAELKGAIVQLTPDPVPEWPSFLVTFIVIIASAILMFTVFMFYRQRTRATISEVSVSRLTSVQIADLPTRKVQNGEADGTCCICLADYGTGDVIMVLPCKHEFHKECIEPWLTRRNRTCPLCKRETFPSERTPLLLAGSPPSRDAAPASPARPVAINNDSSDENRTSEV